MGNNRTYVQLSQEAEHFWAVYDHLHPNMPIKELHP